MVAQHGLSGALKSLDKRGLQLERELVDISDAQTRVLRGRNRSRGRSGKRKKNKSRSKGVRKQKKVKNSKQSKNKEQRRKEKQRRRQEKEQRRQEKERRLQEQKDKELSDQEHLHQQKSAMIETAPNQKDNNPNEVISNSKTSQNQADHHDENKGENMNVEE